MHRGGMGFESGKGGGGAAGRNGYRQDRGGGRGGPTNTAASWPDRSGFTDRSGGVADSSASKGAYAGQQVRDNDQQPSSGTPAKAVVGELENRLSDVQQDFTQALHKISEKENEKFDLIFAILSELQSRQAQLEESVRSLKATYGGGQMPAGGASGPASGGMAQQPQQQQHQQHQQQGQFGSGHSNGQQSYGQQLGGQMAGQQFTGVMQPDGSQAMFTAVPQVVVVQSPTAGGMQYAMPNQMTMMSPMNQMPQQMAMQFMGQGSGQDMGNFVSGGQDGAQSQMPMRSAAGSGGVAGGASWASEAQRRPSQEGSDASKYEGAGQHTGSATGAAVDATTVGQSEDGR